jgi:hypothetical protein
MGRASTVPACWTQYEIPAIMGAYAKVSMMTRLVILEYRIVVLNFSIRASGVRTRYTPVVLAPAMKMRVHACAKPRLAPTYAVANRNAMRTVKISVCPRTPGDRSSLIELGR